MATTPTTPGTNGLIRVMSAQDVIDIKSKDLVPVDDAGLTVNESMLARQIRKTWERNKLHKERISQKLLRCLRARRGLYSSSELSVMEQNGGFNIIWADITETKCRAASAWIRDIVMPAGERAWSITPTPIPELPIEIKDALLQVAAVQAKQSMVAAAKAGQGTMTREEFEAHAQDIADQMADQTLKTYRDKADAAAARMSDKVEEYMDEGGWDKALDEFIEDFVTYPSAILKGPIYQRRKQLEWLPG